LKVNNLNNPGKGELIIARILIELELDKNIDNCLNEIL